MSPRVIKKTLFLGCTVFIMHSSLAITLTSYLKNQEDGSNTDSLTVKYQNCSINEQGLTTCSTTQTSSVPYGSYTSITNSDATAIKIYTVILSAKKGNASTNYAADPSSPNACASPITNISMSYSFDFESMNKTVFCNNIGL